MTSLHLVLFWWNSPRQSVNSNFKHLWMKKWFSCFIRQISMKSSIQHLTFFWHWQIVRNGCRTFIVCLMPNCWVMYSLMQKLMQFFSLAVEQVYTKYESLHLSLQICLWNLSLQVCFGNFSLDLLRTWSTSWKQLCRPKVLLYSGEVLDPLQLDSDDMTRDIFWGHCTFFGCGNSKLGKFSAQVSVNNLIICLCINFIQFQYFKIVYMVLKLCLVCINCSWLVSHVVGKDYTGIGSDNVLICCL